MGGVCHIQLLNEAPHTFLRLSQLPGTLRFFRQSNTQKYTNISLSGVHSVHFKNLGDIGQEVDAVTVTSPIVTF